MLILLSLSSLLNQWILFYDHCDHYKPLSMTGNQTSKELILLNHWHRRRKKDCEKKQTKTLTHTSQKQKKGNTKTAYKNTKQQRKRRKYEDQNHFVLSPNCRNKLMKTINIFLWIFFSYLNQIYILGDNVAPHPTTTKKFNKAPRPIKAFLFLFSFPLFLLVFYYYFLVC